MPSFSFETSFDRFNRYMVECEYDPLDGYKGQDCFLIDTWWNVNLFVVAFQSSLATF